LLCCHLCASQAAGAATGLAAEQQPAAKKPCLPPVGQPIQQQQQQEAGAGGGQMSMTMQQLRQQLALMLQSEQQQQQQQMTASRMNNIMNVARTWGKAANTDDVGALLREGSLAAFGEWMSSTDKSEKARYSASTVYNYMSTLVGLLQLPVAHELLGGAAAAAALTEQVKQVQQQLNQQHRAAATGAAAAGASGSSSTGQKTGQLLSQGCIYSRTTLLSLAPSHHSCSPYRWG
jgi:hypothetical protein